MGDWRNYFSFNGRLNRRPYWLMSLVIVGVTFVGYIIVAMFAALLTIFWVLAAPLVIGFLWAGMSIAVRRLHDRNKSAWWLLLYQGLPLLLGIVEGLMGVSGGGSGPANLLEFVGFCLSMWVLVDLGILRGSAGPNKFGDDPLGPQIQEVFA
jgi:uncharacterized membrane protein YhaH (DUF805 family)